MMKVRLFIEGQSKRPGICREAKAMYLMSYARQNGEEVTRHGSVLLEDATITRAALLALKTALERFTVPTEICLYIGDDIVRNAISKGWLQSWKESGWKKSYGEIAHLDLWIPVEEELSKHQISCAQGEDLEHEYKSWMHCEMENATNRINITRGDVSKNEESRNDAVLHIS